MACIELKHDHFALLRVIRDGGEISTDLGTLAHVYRAGLAYSDGSQAHLTNDGRSALDDYEEVGGFSVKGTGE